MTGALGCADGLGGAGAGVGGLYVLDDDRLNEGNDTPPIQSKTSSPPEKTAVKAASWNHEFFQGNIGIGREV
jgi:hypothetical protein